MNIKLVSFKLCPFVQRAVIALKEKGVNYSVEYIELEDPLRRALHKAWIEYGSELLRQQFVLAMAPDGDLFAEALAS